MWKAARAPMQWLALAVMVLIAAPLLWTAVQDELAAKAAPAVAARHEKQRILGDEAAKPTQEVKTVTGTGHEGPQGSLKLADAQVGAVARAKGDRERADRILTQRLSLAGETTPEESEQARLTVILGAVSSTVFIVFLMQLVDSLFPPRRCKGGGA
jgi:hypothetical protein